MVANAKIAKIIFLIASVFAIYANIFMLLQPIVFRSIFWALIAMAGFLGTTSGFWGAKGKSKTKLMSLLDAVLAILVALSTLLLVIRWEGFTAGVHDATLLENLAAGIMVVIVILATGRLVSWALAGVTVLFLLYALFGDYVPGIFVGKGYELSRVLPFMFWDTMGIYGLPMYIAASYVILFVIFGQFLLSCGGERWFMDASFAAVGPYRGGPAMTSVVTSAAFGMMSGSPVANVVTTGSFTIPLMKEIGYKPQIAAAIEAVASTGGMFTPPIMGAAAFLIAEYTSTAYYKVALAAAIPAALYYATLLCIVYLWARKRDLPVLSKDQIPNLSATLKNYGHLSPPIFILLAMMLSGWSLLWSAFWSIVAILALSLLRKHTRMSIPKIIETLGEAARISMPVVVACAAAGIIFGVISLTGLGFRVSSMLLFLAGDSKFLLLLLTMISAIVLGCAMPPTAAYIILAALVVTSLLEIGLPPLVAHMFIFFFCSIGPITPPVALAAYAAASIADADPNITGFWAFRLGLAAFILPFAFAYNPEILLVGSALEITWAVLRVLLGLLLMAAVFEGFLFKGTPWPARALLAIAGLGFFVHQPYVTLAASVLAFVLIYLNYRGWKKQSPA
ncbi:MAG: TRAP transporter fused permease subunit [Thermodesulfobacteriota bacterium]|nr:TRAP transporter fused permease subunit [Thermodesulfobacteriota bacterium]